MTGNPISDAAVLIAAIVALLIGYRICEWAVSQLGRYMRRWER